MKFTLGRLENGAVLLKKHGLRRFVCGSALNQHEDHLTNAFTGSNVYILGDYDGHTDSGNWIYRRTAVYFFVPDKIESSVVFLSDIRQRPVLPAIFPVKCLERLSESDGHPVSKWAVDVV